MNKLELEYDYETDEEQVLRSKQLLTTENYKAVEFFVQDDPQLLADNLTNKLYRGQYV